MEDKKGAVAIVQWRTRFLGEGVLQEATYDQALMAAEQLERAGSVSASEWLDMVRQANAALLRQPGQLFWCPCRSAQSPCQQG